jgi:hypothetical protein
MAKMNNLPAIAKMYLLLILFVHSALEENSGSLMETPSSHMLLESLKQGEETAGASCTIKR